MGLYKILPFQWMFWELSHTFDAYVLQKNYQPLQTTSKLWKIFNLDFRDRIDINGM